MMDKQQKIVEMAKDICRAQLCCNDVCNPISACDALRYAERAVEAGYSKQNGWISVDERLPEDGEIVLTVDSEGEREVCFYEEAMKGIFQRFGGLVKIFNITHWMPLPEAPKMKGECNE